MIAPVMAASEEPIELSLLEYDALWDHLKLGDRPVVIDAPSHGLTDEERSRLLSQAWSGLDSRGLGSPQRLDAELERRLWLLGRPSLELDVRMRHRDSWLRALLGSDGEQSCAGVLLGDRLELRPVAPGELARTAVSLAPPVQPGSGQSISLPAEQLDAAAALGEPRAIERALTDGGLVHDEAELVVRVLTEVEGFGQFGASFTASYGGVPRRASHVVTYYDTALGRFLFTRRSSGDGAQWATLVPGDPRRMAQQVGELLAEGGAPSGPGIGPVFG